MDPSADAAYGALFGHGGIAERVEETDAAARTIQRTVRGHSECTVEKIQEIQKERRARRAKKGSRG